MNYGITNYIIDPIHNYRYNPDNRYYLSLYHFTNEFTVDLAPHAPPVGVFGSPSKTPSGSPESRGLVMVISLICIYIYIHRVNGEMYTYTYINIYIWW